MKTLDRLKLDLGYEYYKVLTFTHKTTNTKLRRKGYAFYFKDVNPFSTNVYGNLTFEPCQYSNGDKFIVYGNLVRRYINGLFYAKNLPDARKKLLKLMNS